MSKLPAMVLGAFLGAVVTGLITYSLAYSALRQTGMGGGMEGLGRAYQCLCIGVCGALAGAAGGGLFARWLMQKQDKK